MVSTLNTEEINKFLDRDHFKFRKEVHDYFSDPKFRLCYDKKKEMNLYNIRDQAKEMIDVIVKRKLISVRDIKEDPGKYFAFFESFRIPDIGIGMKFSLTYHFFGSAIINLGSDKHQYLLDLIDEGKVFGCFAMTELGHGSNVRAIETTATYDHKTKEFIIHTPNDSAQKYWIGGAACHANYAVVFAQLYINEEKQGVHPFIVQLRSLTDNSVLPGITIVDVGLKHGLNAVDNGRIWFNQVRISRDSLLDRFGTVNENGEYVTSISSSSLRFALNIGELIVARMMIGVPAVAMSKVGLTIAVKYAHTRRQFGSGDKEELIINYKSHQRRLIPALAKCYALNCFSNTCKQLYATRTQETIQHLHILVAAYKISTSWDSADILQTCRECCGGQGYLSRNIISGLRQDIDAFVTIDGDNTMLLQQISRYLLTKFQKEMTASKLNFIRFASKHQFWTYGITTFFNPSSSDNYTLRSAEFQLSVFRWREERLLFSLVNRLKAKVKNVSPLQAWNELLDHSNQLAHAFIERVILESFVYSISELTSSKSGLDSNLRSSVSDSTITVLANLRSLYALEIIQNDPWFLTDKSLTSQQFKAVRSEVGFLCDELKPHLVSLVDSFGIPDYILNGTIAGDWLKNNSKPTSRI